MDYLERIKGLREDRDITQSEIAKYLNVAQNTYSQWKTGIASWSIDKIV